jgi:hypothetical protein
MAGSGLAFGIDRVVDAVVEYGRDFVASDSIRVGIAIFWVIFFFHVIEGAAEMSEDPRSCRFVKRRFWLRICFVLALLGGYQAVVVSTVASLQHKYIMNFTSKWAEVWVGESDAIEKIKTAEADNQDLRYTEVAATKAGHGDDSLGAKIARFIVDGLITGLGWVLACITGGLIAIFILMEGFYCLGINMVLIAIGPICIAFAAHEKTEAIFWSYFKSFLVLGLLYMPMLGFACGFAGLIMAQMTTMVTSSGVVYGDGSDVGVHLLMVVFGPLCSFAVIRAVPALMSHILQAANGGGGSSFAAGAAAAMMVGRAGGGGADAAAKGAAAGTGGGSGALDAAAERGRAEAAVAALRMAGGEGAAGSGQAPAGRGVAIEPAADQVRGET